VNGRESLGTYFFMVNYTSLHSTGWFQERFSLIGLQFHFDIFKMDRAVVIQIK